MKWFSRHVQQDLVISLKHSFCKRSQALYGNLPYLVVLLVAEMCSNIDRDEVGLNTKLFLVLLTIGFPKTGSKVIVWILVNICW